MGFSLNRRAFLRGAGGVAVALPLLEVMRPSRALAAPPPLRYLVTAVGVSIPERDVFVPSVVGPDYDLTPGFAPFADYDVASVISVISGMRIPVAAGGEVPSGGRADSFHTTSPSPLLSGVRGSGAECNGATSDQIVAAALGAVTTFQSLQFCVQASTYMYGFGPQMTMSYKDEGGTVSGIAPTISPQQAFNALFGTYIPPDSDPAVAKLKDLRWRARKSVVDLVRSDAERLVVKLGGVDRKRMEQHLEEIRDLEKRIAALPPVAAGACQIPADPGADVPVGSESEPGSGDTSTGYSGEEQRARVLCDLTRMAFACDLSRVGSLMFTCFESFLNMYELTGQASDLHEITHGGGGHLSGDTATEVSTAIAWHMKHFAYLVDSFRNTPEGDGTLLDHSVIVCQFEGGWGYDPESGGDSSPHSTENMVSLVAGGGGLSVGQHIVNEGGHPAQVLITAMNAMGVPTTTLGEVSGEVPGLRG